MWRWLRGKARVYLNADLTLLGLPGWRFWHAHFRYIILYGLEEWKHWRAFSQSRHKERLKDHKYSFNRNWKGSLYVSYRKMTPEESADELTRLSQLAGDYDFK